MNSPTHETLRQSPLNADNNVVSSETPATLRQNQSDHVKPVERQEVQFDNQFDQAPVVPVGKSHITFPQEVRMVDSIDKRMNQQAYATSVGKEINTPKQSQLPKQSPAKLLKVSIFDRKELFSPSEGPLHPLQMEFRIKQIAKCIRQRVKRHSPSSIDHEGEAQQTVRIKNIEKQSYRLREKVLSPINKPSNTINFPINSGSKLLTFEESIDRTIDNEHMIRQLVRKDILDKVWHRIELEEKLRRNKLKLDPIKHKYPITTFRRAVLEEDKQMTLQEMGRLKEREQKLTQRRNIYNSSRYERYIHQGKTKGSGNDITVESLVLLKQTQQCSIDLIQNPEAATSNSPQEILFPTQVQGSDEQTHKNKNQMERKPEPNHQVQKMQEQDQDYAEDFL